MKRSVLLMLMVVLAVGQLGYAQQANQNINVLPIPQDPADTDAYLKGDLYLQRQVEPTIVESTRNPDHLLAFFVDYRAVDIPDDIGLGQSEDVAESRGPLRTLLAKLFGRSTQRPELPAQAAAAEAWIGGSRSYDGGSTWSGFFVPGAFWDTAPASALSPVYGLEAATDPVAAPAPCGAAYVGGIFFTRGGESKMVVIRYRDLNNDEGGDTWVYDGMSVVETGNNADNGHFIDKPFVLVDPDRLGGGGACAHNLYVSYSTFNGLAKDGKFQSKVNFAHLFDDGANLESSTYSGPTFIEQEFDTQTIHKTYKQNQGTWMAVDPRPGTPSSGGGGTVYVFWRHFFDPDAILLRSTSNFGQSFTPNPKEITGDLNLATFDQLGISTASGPGFLSFRSNAYPTATVSTWDDGMGGKDATILVAFQERVDDVGFSDPWGSPRVMVLRSQDDGSTWTDVFGNSPEQRHAVDIGPRDVGAVPDPGFGALPQPRAEAGPQVMPTISCGPGRCMLTYYESRGLLNFNQVDQKWGILNDADSIEIVPNSVNAGFISDIRRLMDLRAAKLSPVTGALESLENSVQVSRYAIRFDADFSDGETVDDVMLASERPCLPYDYDPLDPDTLAYPPCSGEPALNRVNKPQSGSGTTPFIGDYNFLIPAQRMVPNASQTGWEWLIDDEQNQFDAFRAIWTDNRNLIRPEAEPEFQQYSNYGPPGAGGACANVGSRNTDTLTALVEADLILQAPTTFKQLDANHSFPLSLMNASGLNRFYRLKITTGAEYASFALLDDIDEGGVEIFPYSSIAQVVYVDETATGQIRVEVREIYGVPDDRSPDNLIPDGASGFITFNADGTNPSVGGLGDVETLDAEVSEPEVTNPFALNPFALNPFALNFSPSNPFALNPFALNPFALNTNPEDVVDTTWTVTSGVSDTASSYVALPNIDNIEAFQENYAFQLLIYRNSSVGSGDPGICATYEIEQEQLLSNVVQNPFALNPFALNPFALNPFALNPFALNPFALNSAFTMAPTDVATESASLRPGPSLPSFDDGTTKDPRSSNAVQVTLRAIPLNEDLDCTDPQSSDYCFDPTQDPPSLLVVPMSCGVQDPNWIKDGEWFQYGNIRCKPAFFAPDLVPELTEPSFPPEFIMPGGEVVVTAGDTVDFPFSGWDLYNQGNSTGTAENTILRHGFYLSSDDMVDITYDKDTDELVLGDDDVLLGYQESLLQSVGPKESQRFDEGIPLTIPADLPPGDYNLVVYVDDRLEVSEVDDYNNYEIAQFAITVEEPNTAPVAQPASYTINEDEVYPGTLAANDAEEDSLTFEIVDDPLHGEALITDTNSGAFQYTPDENYFGTDSFTFRAFDGEFYSDPAAVSFTITGVNDAPVATEGQSFGGDEDSLISGQLLATDVEGSELTFNLVTPPSFGTLVLNSDGFFTYTPNENDNGTDTFVFTVCDADGLCAERSASVTVEVTSVEDLPVAVDDSATTNEDEAVTVDVLANDSDGDGDPLTISAVSQGASGTLVNNGTNLTYTPADDFCGTDSFTYTIGDGKGGSDTAAVTVTVTCVNDPPVAIAGADETVSEGEAMSFSGSVTDPDVGDTHTYAWDFGDGASASGQTVSHTYADNGIFTVILTVTDAEGESDADSLSVTVENVAPTVDAGTGGTVDEGGTFTGSGSFTDPGADSWTATVDYGDDSGELPLAINEADKTFSLIHIYASDDVYTVTVTVIDDDGGSGSATAAVNVTNVPPVANGQSVTTAEDTPIAITLTGADAGGDALEFEVVAGPSAGSLSGTPPSLTYTPNDDFAGEDSFNFVAKDGMADSDEATISITITAVNDTPVAVDDDYSTPEDTPLTVSAPGVLGNDSDVDGPTLTATLVPGPLPGTLILNGDGSFTYSPPKDVFDTFGFTYIVSDGEYSSEAAVTINVLPINDAPVANDDAYVRTEGASLSVAAPGVLENDTDVDGDSLSAALATGAVNGLAVVAPDGGFTYTPNAGFFGSDSFIYEASDNNDGSDTATVTVGVPYGFIGLLSPWKEPNPIYTINRGSSFPISWQYTDPATGQLVDSENAMIEVRIKGAFNCNEGENGDLVEVIKFPGNSDYRYSSGTHKLNWDTNNQVLGCYNVRVYSGLTGQLDGPFIVRIRK